MDEVDVAIDAVDAANDEVGSDNETAVSAAATSAKRTCRSRKSSASKKMVGVQMQHAAALSVWSDPLGPKRRH